MGNVVGTPSVGGMKSAAINYAVGAGGGLIFALSQAVTGSGLLGGLIGAALAGSVIKGTRGEIIATVLGFQTIVSGMGSAASNASSESSAPAVM